MSVGAPGRYQLYARLQCQRALSQHQWHHLRDKPRAVVCREGLVLTYEEEDVGSAHCPLFARSPTPSTASSGELSFIRITTQHESARGV